MHREPLISASLGVTLFWFVLLTSHGVWTGDIDVRDLLGLSFYLETLKWPIAGALSGVGIAWFAIYLERRYAFESLASHSRSGITTSIGMVPIHLNELSTKGERISEQALLAVARLGNTLLKQPEPPKDFLAQWYERFEKSAPAHAALMRKLEGVLMYHRQMPATHVREGNRNHGGRSLLEHSLLLALLMEAYAKDFQYPADPGSAHLPLLDERYRFNPVDPLIALLGVAHDIGKIECYQFEPDDVDRRRWPVACRPDHDRTGARCLARMPEVWQLPDEDREIFLLVVAHYHVPQDMPMASAYAVRSDRMHALMELLIKWDNEGSALENKEPIDLAVLDSSTREAAEKSAVPATTSLARSASEPSAVPAAATAVSAPIHAPAVPAALSAAGTTQADARARLWAICKEILLEPGRINGKDRKRNMGWKYHFPHTGRTLLFLVEDAFVKTVAARGNLEEEMVGHFDGPTVDPLTRKILLACHAQGVLYLDFEDARSRPPDILVYVAGMWEPKAYFVNTNTRLEVKALGKGKEANTLGSVIVLDITDAGLPELVGLKDNNRVPAIKHFRLGALGKRGSKSKSGTTAPPEVLEPGQWYVAEAADRAGAEQQAPAVAAADSPTSMTSTEPNGVPPHDETLVDELDEDGLPAIAARSAPPSQANTPAEDTWDPFGGSAAPAAEPEPEPESDTNKSMSAGFLFHLAKDALQAGAIDAQLLLGDTAIVLYPGKRSLYTALGLGAFGYPDEAAFILDAMSGRIPEVTAGEINGTMIVRVTPSAEALNKQ